MKLHYATQQRRINYFWYGILAALQGLAALWISAASPSESDQAVLLGLSSQRFLLLFPVAFLTILAGLLAWNAWKNSDQFSRFVLTFETRLTTSRLLHWFIFILFAIFIFCATFLLVFQQESLFVFAPIGGSSRLTQNGYFVQVAYQNISSYLPRLLPIALYGFGFSLQTLIGLPILLYGNEKVKKHLITYAIPTILITFSLLSIILFFTVKNLQVLGDDFIGWNTVGAPILDIQVVAAFLASLILLGAGIKLRKQKVNSNNGGIRQSNQYDKWIFLIIWGIAALHWTTIQMEPSWYMAAPAPPNYELYPKSDAIVYDLTAQSMLVGEGLQSQPFNDEIVRRPLYTFLVGILTLVAGPDYLSIGILQSILLAVFPAVVFLIGRDLNTRQAGLLAAMLIILREGNTIALADVITVSHTRLIMADPITATGLSLFIYFLLPWLYNPEQGNKSALIAGGFLGGLMLIRPETLVVGLAAVVPALYQVRRKISNIIPGGIWLGIGLLLVLTPWLWRNYERTGQIYFEIPGNRLDFLIQRLNTEQGALPDRPILVKNAAMAVDQHEKSTSQYVLSHFLNSNLQSVLIFPTIFRPFDASLGYFEHEIAGRFWESCCDRANYVHRLDFWDWYKWDLHFPIATLPSVALTILILATGMVFVLRKHGVVGIMPFVAGEAYIMINALARTSGGRYLLPIDWIWIVYYAVGLSQLSIWMIRGLSRAEIPEWLCGRNSQEMIRLPQGSKGQLLPAISILLIGMLLPIGERLFPKQYPDQPPQVWIDRSVDLSEDPNALRSALDHPGTIILNGNSLYPRYYDSNIGDPGRSNPSSFPRPYPRLSLNVAGPINTGIVIGLREIPEVVIHHNEDILVIGCRINHPKLAYLEGLAIYLPEQDVLIERNISETHPSCSELVQP